MKSSCFCERILNSIFKCLVLFEQKPKTLGNKTQESIKEKQV